MMLLSDCHCQSTFIDTSHRSFVIQTVHTMRKKWLRGKFLLMTLMLLCACSPRFNWREFHSNEAPYSILMPGKPSSLSKDVQLGGLNLTMHMDAVEVSDLNFAVGSVKLNDPGQAWLVREAMKAGLINNIHGHITKDSHMPDAVIEISGKARDGTTLNMAVRLIIQGPRVYQILVLGPESRLQPEIVETFMTSFHAN